MQVNDQPGPILDAKAADHLTMTNRRILVIDDNESIHRDFRKILCPEEQGRMDLAQAAAMLFQEATKPATGAPFEMDSAFQGEEGWEMLIDACAAGRPYAVAFVDVRMPPGWDGVETIAHLWKLDADLQVVICTAHSDYSLAEITERLGETDRLLVLKKPFDAMEVVQLANALTEKWSLLQQSRIRTEELERRVAIRTRELQERQEELQEARKLELVGQLAGGVAHDFNTLLTTIIGRVELLHEDLPEQSQLREHSAIIRSSAHRAADLTQKLLAFGRKQILQPTKLDFHALLLDIVELLQPLLGQKIAVKTALHAKCPSIKADLNQLQQVFVSLALNARDAMPDGGTLTFETSDTAISAEAGGSAAELAPGDYLKVAVVDTGTGIPSTHRPHLFEPFFTTKPQGQGTGLGLAMCYGILKQSGGHIEISSDPVLPTTFHLYLPKGIDLSPQLPATPAPSRENQPVTMVHILLLETDLALRDLITTVLETDGFAVHPAGEEGEALSLAAANPIALAIVNGTPANSWHLRVAERIQTRVPNLKVLSLVMDNSQPLHSATGLNITTLRKPFTPKTLLRELHGLCQRQ